MNDRLCRRSARAKSLCVRHRPAQSSPSRTRPNRHSGRVDAPRCRHRTSAARTLEKLRGRRHEKRSTSWCAPRLVAGSGAQLHQRLCRCVRRICWTVAVHVLRCPRIARARESIVCRRTAIFGGAWRTRARTRAIAGAHSCAPAHPRFACAHTSITHLHTATHVERQRRAAYVCCRREREIA